MNDDELILKIAEVNQTFTPSSPISSKELFADRFDHVMKVMDTITRPGQHAILFGERGVGKTSLANVIHSFLPKSNRFYPIKVSGSAETNFTEIWRGIFREMQLQSVAKGFVPTRDEVNAVLLHFIDQDNPIPITPLDVRFILSQLPFQNVIIIIDELDRIKDEKTISDIVDTIKTLSDYSLPVTLLMVAVGDSVNILIKEHASLSRALVQIQLPRMSENELGEIIQRGVNTLRMTMDKNVKEHIIKLSQGLPHYTHLLSLESITVAIKNGRGHVEEDDLRKAIEIALEKTQESTSTSYYKAVNAPRGILYPQILLGCALSKFDTRNFFSPSDVSRALKKLTNEEYSVARFTRHLRQFSTPERGSVLTETGTKGKYKYRFTDPMMQPFLILKGIADKQISVNELS